MATSPTRPSPSLHGGLCVKARPILMATQLAGDHAQTGRAVCRSVVGRASVLAFFILLWQGWGSGTPIDWGDLLFGVFGAQLAGALVVLLSLWLLCQVFGRRTSAG